MSFGLMRVRLTAVSFRSPRFPSHADAALCGARRRRPGATPSRLSSAGVASSLEHIPSVLRNPRNPFEPNCPPSSPTESTTSRHPDIQKEHGSPFSPSWRPGNQHCPTYHPRTPCPLLSTSNFHPSRSLHRPFPRSLETSSSLSHPSVRPRSSIVSATHHFVRVLLDG